MFLYTANKKTAPLGLRKEIIGPIHTYIYIYMQVIHIHTYTCII
jgi:hypothetical protein